MFTTFVLHHYCPLGSPGGPAQRAPCGIVGLGIQPNDANLTLRDPQPHDRWSWFIDLPTFLLMHFIKKVLPICLVIYLYNVCIKCHTIPYHTIPYHPIQTYHAIPYHTMPYHTIPYHIIPYHTYKHTMPYHTMPYHTIPYHTIPYHAIPYIQTYKHTIPYHTIPTNTPYHTYKRAIPVLLHKAGAEVSKIGNL